VLNGQPVGNLSKFEDIERFLFESRTSNWEDELSHFLDSGAITAAAVKKAFPRNRGIAEYLSERAKRKQTTETA
jgi:hypothetical protein